MELAYGFVVNHSEYHLLIRKNPAESDMGVAAGILCIWFHIEWLQCVCIWHELPLSGYNVCVSGMSFLWALTDGAVSKDFWVFPQSCNIINIAGGETQGRGAEPPHLSYMTCIGHHKMLSGVAWSKQDS